LTDRRERVLTAGERREGSREEVARRFRVAVSTLYLWLKQARETGRRAPKPPARGRSAGATLAAGGRADDATLAVLVAERNDATLAEYADRLAERIGVRRSLAAVCRALKGLGLVRKKRRSGPPSRSARTWPRLT
jgi:transposase